MVINSSQWPVAMPATHTDYEHNSTLNAMMLTFADVVSTDDVVKLLCSRPGEAADCQAD